MKRALLIILAVMCILPIYSCDSSSRQGSQALAPAGSNTDDMPMPTRSYKDYNGNDDEWAVYWYLCGSDLESESGLASLDLAEMMLATLPGDVTAVIQTGGAEEWHNSVISAEELGRYVYKGNKLELVESLPLASMGDPRVLADFLDFCNANYPAKKQALIMWDHGGGSLFGMEIDRLFDNDSLSLPEFEEAIKAMPAASGTYEVVGFDACLMATIDIARILQGSAKYMVASQEIEPGIGWDYTALFKALADDSSIGGEELGIAICDSYYAACEEYAGMAEQVTLSVVDIEKAGSLLSAYDDLGDEALLLAASEQLAYLGAMGRAAYDSEKYGGGNYEMIDLGSFVSRAGNLLPEQGDALLDALDECVAYQVMGEYRSGATGLSCYYLSSGSRTSYELFDAINPSQPFSYFFEYAIDGKMSEGANDYVNKLASDAGVRLPAEMALAQTSEMGFRRHPVYVGPDGNWRLVVGRQKAYSLAAVLANVMWLDPVSGLQVMFGTSHNLKSSWQYGVFTEQFDGMWGCIDDAQVYMEPISVDYDRAIYSIPIHLNSEPYNLYVGYYSYGDLPEDSGYEILGAWKTSNELDHTASRELVQLVPGDIVEPIQYLVPLHENGDRTIEAMPIGSITVTEDTKFHTKSLGDGYFALTFEMIDYAGNRFYSSQASFRVRNGNIVRLASGIHESSEQPAGSLPVEFIQSNKWLHDAWNQEITYYTATISSEEYAKLATSLGIAKDGDTTDNGGYSIHLVSNTLNLADYSGVRKAYIAGYYMRADTIWHRRDIVFNVEELTEAW
ncbi:MAG: clostripain-related cysteine peptidase [Eubacteriaceae bacterium]|nr:clostripain-related cysteine peptidase [Eubacteriaceae bacterium]